VGVLVLAGAALLGIVAARQAAWSLAPGEMDLAALPAAYWLALAAGTLAGLLALWWAESDTWLSAGVARVLGYLPHVLAAGAVLVVAYFAGNFIYGQMASREGASTFGARLVRGGILALAAFMALQELGIATAIVTIAFTVAIAATGVAAAVAFGLGNRELAGRVTRDWYERRGPRYRKYEPGYEERQHQGEQTGPLITPAH
jgi:hypothetical protein